MRNWCFVLVLVLFFGIVSGHTTCWNMDGGAVLSYEKFDNLNRYPIEDYKFGYTYRATDDFRERYEDDWDVKLKRGKYWGKGSWEKRHDWNKDYYYDLKGYPKRWEKVECYHRAPKGKLIYRKCP